VVSCVQVYHYDVVVVVAGHAVDLGQLALVDIPVMAFQQYYLDSP